MRGVHAFQSEPVRPPPGRRYRETPTLPLCHHPRFTFRGSEVASNKSWERKHRAVSACDAMRADSQLAGYAGDPSALPPAPSDGRDCDGPVAAQPGLAVVIILAVASALAASSAAFTSAAFARKICCRSGAI